MSLLGLSTRHRKIKLVLAACAVTGLLATAFPVTEGRQTKAEVLVIGATAAGPKLIDKRMEEATVETLKGFIKEETGFGNEIVQFNDWRELAAKMAKKEIHLGVFQGYEYAWATEKTTDFKPLAVAVNVYVYPVAYVVAKRTNAAKDFGDLQSESVAVPDTGQYFLNVFMDKECQDRGKSPDKFFSKITTPANVEEALDDVVDGVLNAVVVDRTGLEAYKRRKPGRFSQLKEIAHSQPFPPPLVAYYDNVLDDQTLTRFQSGLLQARTKEKGQTMLTLFKLTGFDKVPPDLDKVLAETRKNYPPPSVAQQARKK